MLQSRHKLYVNLCLFKLWVYLWACSVTRTFIKLNVSFVTVQQSSFYGYTSMLPSRYTQAVMAGESKYVCKNVRVRYISKMTNSSSVIYLTMCL